MTLAFVPFTTEPFEKRAVGLPTEMPSCSLIRWCTLEGASTSMKTVLRSTSVQNIQVVKGRWTPQE